LSFLVLLPGVPTLLTVSHSRCLERGVCKSAFSHPTGYAIRRAAEADLVRLRRYEIPIKRVARKLCLDPALIGGIMSQESRVGLLLDNGWDRGQQKYGLMQVLQGDNRQQLRPYVAWDSEEHINQCSNILVLSINEVRARHPTWTWDRQLRDGISAYNADVNTVQTYDKMIVGKTHNYDDVDARVRLYKRNEY
uniref:Lysozyme g n=1 Tax=Catharus ustulatus TaxID=91951 RepID=A0A8C3UKH5_CATUS